nr:MAG TPA: hypothetical protein [Caudoviricetes sp.]
MLQIVNGEITMIQHKALYAYYEGDELIAVGTARELSNMLHTTINNIRRRARKEKDIIKVGYLGDDEQ